MNLSNKITLVRIVLIPVFIIFLTLNIRYRDIIAATIFILLSLTDALDGYFARKRKEITRIGKIIDPIADKLLISAALIFLIGRGVKPWMAFIIIAREILVTGLRVITASKGVTISASKLGKIKTISQTIAIVGILISPIFGYYLLWIAVVLTIISGIDYYIKMKNLIRENEI